MGSSPSKLGLLDPLPTKGFLPPFSGDQATISPQLSRVFKFLLHLDTNQNIPPILLVQVEKIISAEWFRPAAPSWLEKRRQKHSHSQQLIHKKLLKLFSQRKLFTNFSSQKKKISLLLIYLTLTMYTERNYFFAFHAGRKCLQITKSARWKRSVWMPIVGILHYIMGRLYSGGRGCSIDDTKAMKHFMQCVEFENEKKGILKKVWNEMALVNLASMIQHGYGCQKRSTAAWNIAKYCVDHKFQNSSRAMTLLGNILYEGSNPNYDKEAASKYAFDLYLESAKSGKCKYAVYNLASCFERGEGVDRDLSKAMQLYEYALTLEHNHSKSCIQRVMRTIQQETLMGNL